MTQEQERSITADTAAVELGSELRRQREQKNLSIGEVSERLKLPARQIEALESGNYEKLPEPVFVRGFLRSYGRFLEMDETTLNSYLEYISPPPKVNHSTAGINSAELNFANEKVSKPFPTWIFGVIGAIAIGSGVYFWQTKSQNENAKKAAEEAGAPIVADNTAGSQVVPPNVNGGNATVVAMPASEAVAASAASSPAAGILSPGELAITTRYRTMLTVTNAKGEVLINQIVPSRSEHRFKEGAPFEVRVGYAIGSTATFSGQNIDIDSKRKGKTAVFTVGGASDPAAPAQ